MKQRLVVCGLALLALWPLAQRALVVRFDVDPWKLGGFAMYCAPRPRVEIGLFDATDGDPVPIPPARLTASVREAVREFRARRILLGRLASYQPLARALLDARPEIERLRIEVTRIVLDRASARVASETIGYSASRGGSERRP